MKLSRSIHLSHGYLNYYIKKDGCGVEMGNISVAMATYNGEKYISEQLDSILPQLAGEDELIISDDNSKDNTVEIIKGYIASDDRIKLFSNLNSGVIKNFENAIKLCKNEIVFLCDQDDVWVNNKVAVTKKYFENDDKLMVIVSDAYVTDDKLNVIIDSFFKSRNSQKGVVRNIIKNSYLGCTMAFRQSAKPYFLPIPSNIGMHDMWIGISMEMFGETKFIAEKLVYYRRHESTVTKINKSKFPNIRSTVLRRKNLVLELYKRNKIIKKRKIQ